MQIPFSVFPKICWFRHSEIPWAHLLKLLCFCCHRWEKCKKNLEKIYKAKKKYPPTLSISSAMFLICRENDKSYFRACMKCLFSNYWRKKETKNNELGVMWGETFYSLLLIKAPFWLYSDCIPFVSCFFIINYIKHIPNIYIFIKNILTIQGYNFVLAHGIFNLSFLINTLKLYAAWQNFMEKRTTHAGKPMYYFEK